MRLFTALLSLISIILGALEIKPIVTTPEDEDDEDEGMYVCMYVFTKVQKHHHI